MSPAREVTFLTQTQPRCSSRMAKPCPTLPAQHQRWYQPGKRQSRGPHTAQDTDIALFPPAGCPGAPTSCTRTALHCLALLEAAQMPAVSSCPAHQPRTMHKHSLLALHFGRRAHGAEGSQTRDPRGTAQPTPLCTARKRHPMENAFALTRPPKKYKKQQKGKEMLQERGCAPREEGKQQRGRAEPGAPGRALATTQAARGAEGEAPASSLLQGTGAAAEDGCHQGGRRTRREEKKYLFGDLTFSEGLQMQPERTGPARAL